MNLQEQLLRKFQEVYEDPKLRIVSEITGLNLSRIFRIYQGSVMKLDEYELFLRLIDKREKHHQKLRELISEAEIVLNKDQLECLFRELRRKIREANLANV